MRNFTLRPRITVSDQEYHQLVVLALTGSGHSAAANDNLFYELDRARVVPETSLPSDVVRMGSFVTYRDDEGDEHSVMLVYPGHEDAETGRVSVLTPVGTALLGLRVGHSISWRSDDCRSRFLTVLRAGPVWLGGDSAVPAAGPITHPKDVEAALRPVGEKSCQNNRPSFFPPATTPSFRA